MTSQRNGIRTVIVRAPWIAVFVATLAAQAPQSFDVVSIKPRNSVVPLRVELPSAAQVLSSPPPVLTPRLNGQPLSGLVRRLEGLLRQRVIDDTRLQGLYDIEFSYPETAGGQRDAGGDGSSLFTLLQEQLGMRLVGGRAAVDVLVIDSAQEPTPN